MDLDFSIDLSDITEINIDLDVMLKDLIDLLGTQQQCFIQIGK